MDVETQKEPLTGNTKLHSSYSNVINDYRNISDQYTKATGDLINRDPVASVQDYPLRECRYSVSIVIPAWNSKQSLIYTLKSLRYNNLLITFPDKTEVIIVDDGSDDNIQDLLSKEFFPYKIVYIRQIHLGRAQAINMAVHHSRNDIIVFCDADLIIPPYAFDELIKRQQMFLHEAIFFGFRQDVMQSEIGERVEDFMNDLVIDFQKDNRFLTDFPGLWGTNMMLETEWLQGMTCSKNIYVTNNIKGVYDCWQLYRMPYGFLFSVSRENILKVGGFAEYLEGWGFDDTEFCAKSIRNGVKLIPVPSAFVGHIYHPIRQKTQWEDGAKNERRMEERLRSLDFKNYIVDSIDDRIEVIKTINPSIEFDKSNNTDYLFRCVQTGYKYHYVLGNLNEALSILGSTSSEDLNSCDVDCLLDMLIRLDRKDVFYRKKESLKAYYESYYFKLCMFLFDRIEPKHGWVGNYIDIASDLGADELCKRADFYFDEQQWYLALRDYFGAYLLNAEKKDALSRCWICSRWIMGKGEH